MCVWINSYIAQESKIFDEGVEGGYFIKRSDGSVWQYDAWVGLDLRRGHRPESLTIDLASWNGICRLYKSCRLRMVPRQAG